MLVRGVENNSGKMNRSFGGTTLENWGGGDIIFLGAKGLMDTEV